MNIRGGKRKMRYFTESMDTDGVQSLEVYKSELDDNLGKIELFEMKRDIGGQMWCDEVWDFVEKGMDCGRFCKHYKPCNGKSGRCRNLKNGFKVTGRKFLLTENGLREITIVP